MPRRIASLALIFVIGLETALVIGCANSVEPPLRPASLDPETELTYAPLENDTTSVQVQLYWNGFDRDGEVVKFYFAVDADTMLPITEWRSTTAKDSTFRFPVDPITESRPHVFMVSAVDNDGRYDRTPALRFFFSRTKPPTSQITRGPAPYNPLVPPTFTFEWSGTDPDGSPRGGPAPVDSFEYLLLRIGEAAAPGHPALPYYSQTTYEDLIHAGPGPTLPAPYDDWKWVGIRGKGKRFSNVPPGECVFVERAVDGAGAIEKTLKYVTNIRHFTVIPGNPPVVGLGPRLTIHCSSLTQPLYASGPIDVPRDPIQALEGEAISFSWSASADSYGGAVVGYTHALDDTTHLPYPDPLATAATLTRAQLYPGGHVLFIKVIDDVGLVTNAAIPIFVVHPTFKDPGAAREVLYVDDSLGPGNMTSRFRSYPSDTEETNWWTLSLLPNLGVPFTEWDTNLAAIGGYEGREAPSLRDLSRYSTVVWNVDFNSPTGLHRTLFEDTQSALAVYLRGGGTLILTGFAIGSNVSRPLSTLYGSWSRGICATLEPGDTYHYDLTYFSRTYMGIDGARYNGDGLRTLGARDFIAGIPTAAGIAAGYDSTFLDRGPLGSGAKWITYPGSGDPNTNNAPGLGQVDGWLMAQNFGCEPNAAEVFKPEDPSKPIAQPVLLYHGVNVGANEEGGPSPREGMVVGVQVQAHGLGQGPAPAFDPSHSLGRMVHLAFPLYFLRDQDAVRILKAAYSYVSASPTLP